jgi:ABC-type methionine transport system ATPase subunit
LGFLNIYSKIHKCNRLLVYPLRFRGIKSDPALCGEFLGRIGFQNRRKQHARSLSGGEQQKLAMLRALIFEPRFVIIDEALTDLDIDSLDMFMFEGMILDIQKRKPIIRLVISHQLPHIRRICEHIFFMIRGHLETEGSADQIPVRPENPLVKSYLKHETIDPNIIRQRSV